VRFVDRDTKVEESGNVGRFAISVAGTDFEQRLVSFKVLRGKCFFCFFCFSQPVVCELELQEVGCGRCEAEMRES